MAKKKETTETVEVISFYPDKKEGLSPSALQAWIENRSSFIKSYFLEERIQDTAAMSAGKKIHKLIEAGLMPAKKVFTVSEKEIRIELAPGKVIRGFPDSHEELTEEEIAEQKGTNNLIEFVDYKSGKANGWEEKLGTDIKMKATAWLVWMKNDKPAQVRGYIEYFATQWDADTREIVPIEGVESELVETVYRYGELDEFTDVILKAFKEINEFYLKWLDRTDKFINEQDLEEYVSLKTKKEKLEMEMGAIAERILDEMNFGGITTHKTPLGTFYITERKTFEYPEKMILDNGMDLATTEEQVDALEKSIKKAKKNYELIAEPISTATSMGFRKPTEK